MDTDGSVETARNRISKALSQDDWFRSQPVLTLAAAAALFAGVFALRQVSGDAKDAITMLYALPVALIALRFGAAAGLGAAALGMALFGVWAESDDSNIGWLGVLSRAVALFLIGGLVGYFSDRLRSVLETVRGKEEQLQSIIDNTTAVIYLKDEDGRYLLINRQFERLFHIDRHEVIGKTDYDLFPRYMADAFRSNDRRTLKGGTALELEEVAPHDDGPHTYISLKFPVLDAAGASYGVCGISTDITTRKGTEAALKEGQDRVRRILDTAHEAFVSMDGKGVIRVWNSAAEETFGWPRAKVIGRPLAEVIIPPRFREAHQRGIEQFVKTGQGPLLGKRIELPALHRKGHELPVELTISPVKVQGGYTFNAFLHDVSERKRAEEDETRLTPLGPFGEEPPGPV
jgi:PAS domain S-box-containing protein